MDSAHDRLLGLAAGYATAYLDSLPTRRVGATASPKQLVRLLGGTMPEGPSPAEQTIALLNQAAEEGGVVASSGPRFFGFVVGGTHPVSIATDWLVSAWDQNSGVYDLGPAVATAEQVTAEWLVDLLGLPPGTSVGFPTGCAMAHVAALAAARHNVLEEVGWDVERDGLQSAPLVNVVASEQRHLTVDLALRYLGFGMANTRLVPTDAHGRMLAYRLPEILRTCEGPTIVCTQIGDVNTGAVDPVGAVCDIAHDHDAWVHVDGAFGLWAAASPKLRHLVAGVEHADSWASDAHKLLNVPYDCGLVFVANPDAHRAAMLSVRPGYLPDPAPGERDPIDWVPDFSRRARSLPVWATLRTLGRSGVAEQVERCCALARRFADHLRDVPGVRVLNDGPLNQVLVRFGDDDEVTRTVIRRLQNSGDCWFGGTMWQGSAAMRISVSSWQTTAADVDHTAVRIAATVTEVLPP